jgi:hypothetical protein
MRESVQIPIVPRRSGVVVLTLARVLAMAVLPSRRFKKSR